MTDFVNEVDDMYEQSGGLPEVDQMIYLAALDRDTKKLRELTQRIYVDLWKTKEGAQLAALNEGADPEPMLKLLLTKYAQRHGEDAQLYLFRLQDIARDLLLADSIAAPVAKAAPAPEPSEDDRFAALVDQVRRDMEDPAVSAVTIRERRRNSPEYARAFAVANQPEAAPKADVSAEVRNFARQYEETANRLGVAALKPVAGFVTLYDGPTPIRYEFAKFERLCGLMTQHAADLF